MRTWAPESAASRQSASASAVLPMPASPLIRTRLPRPSRAAVRRSCRRASSRSRPTRGGGGVGEDDLTAMRDLANVEQDASSKVHRSSGTHRGAEEAGIAEEDETWDARLIFASRTPEEAIGAPCSTRPAPNWLGL